MSHTHQDRVAERDACLCVAYGCPLMGTMTGSTSGANDWSCAYHANKPATQRDEITLVLNRQRWLASVITDIRRGMVPTNPDRAKLLERIRNDFTKVHRLDLHWDTRENVRQWLARLDKALDELVAPELLAQPRQEVLPTSTDTWQNAAVHVPLWG